MIELLANWGEFIGGIAVVLSLIYLGLQVRASVRQSQLESYNKFAELFTEWTSSIYGDTDTANLFGAGLSDYSSLDEVGKVRFHLMMGMYFGIADTVMAHKEKGIYPYPEAYRRHLDMALGFYSMPGVKQWWDDRGRDIPAPQIIAYLENLPEKE